MRKQHLAILSDNKPGVLTHIAGLISRKAINIESLTVGYTETVGNSTRPSTSWPSSSTLLKSSTSMKRLSSATNWP